MNTNEHGSVSVVMPTWNRAALLADALASLAAGSRVPDEVVVVDNGSTDDSVAVARDAGARVVEMATNAGFARAVNAGIEAASGELVAILNNDVVVEADWLERLCNAIADSGFAVGKLLGLDGLIDGTWDAVCRGGCSWRCGQGREDGGVWNAGREVRFAPLTAALFRADVFRQVGMLDDTYGSYLEDVDFGIRCAMRDVRGIYVPDAVARHRGSATYGEWSRDTVRLLARNQVVFVARNLPDSWLARYGWPVMVAQMLWGLVALRHGRFSAWARGKREGIGLFRALRRDRHVHDAQKFHKIIREAEDEIQALQKATGYDLFWRLYFALT